MDCQLRSRRDQKGFLGLYLKSEASPFSNIFPFPSNFQRLGPRSRKPEQGAEHWSLAELKSYGNGNIGFESECRDWIGKLRSMN
jgi:hypothetical protein